MATIIGRIKPSEVVASGKFRLTPDDAMWTVQLNGRPLHYDGGVVLNRFRVRLVDDVDREMRRALLGTTVTYRVDPDELTASMLDLVLGTVRSARTGHKPPREGGLYVFARTSAMAVIATSSELRKLAERRPIEGLVIAQGYAQRNNY